ncbi:MAG: uroporphyrinogen decarboxylase family protein [Planctomycetota bacterium]
MLPRERFLRQLSGETADEPFLWESGLWSTAVDRWRKEGLAADADPYEHLGLERIASTSVSPWPDPPLAERVVRDEGESLLIDMEGGGRYRRFKHIMIPGNATECQEEPIIFCLRDRESWRFLQTRLDPRSPGRIEARRGFVEGERQSTRANIGLSASFDPTDGFATLIYVMTPGYWLVRTAGLAATALMLYDEPSLVEEIYEYVTYFLETQLAAIFEKRVPDALALNEGSAASGHGEFMSPEMYRRFALPGLARLAGVCREAGVRFVFIHSGGDVGRLASEWKEIGANGLLPLDAATDIERLCRDHRDIALIGGIDRRALEGSPERLKAEVRRKAGVLFGHGRAIPSGDAHFPISDKVSLGNMKRYVTLLREAARRAW